MELYKFVVTILKKSFLAISWLKTCQKSNMAAIFWQFSSHKMAKKQNFQNRLTKFVELHADKLQTKFQVPSI